MNSNHLRSLSNQDLHQELVSLSSQERKLTVQVLHHLREAESRMLYAERGHSSLFEYVVNELHYSESSAQRRISAMRALRDLPELEVKIETGELKVTQLSQVQSFLRNEKKEGKTYSVQAKRELILETVGKSARETEKILADRNPAFLIQDQVKAVSAELTQITFTVDETLLEKLGAIQDRYAHQLPAGASPSDLIRFMAEFVLKHDPMMKEGRKKKLEPECTAAAEVNLGRASKDENEGGSRSEISEGSGLKVKSHDTGRTRAGSQAGQCSKSPTVSGSSSGAHSRYIPAAVKRQVWKEHGGRCVHKTKDGIICGSRHRVQVDHVVPYALGGSSTDPENLRILCWAHNAHRARETFGN